MSDALCGPSNALQNLKNHSSVDRTLQQDRLVSRQQSGQGFRSYDPNTGILDPEFEAFQAGQPSAFSGPIFPTHDQLQPLHRPQHYQHAVPFSADPSQAPAWASDFQNMHVSPSQPRQQQLHQPQNAAWTNQFQQTNGKSPMSSTFASPGMQYNAAPSFAMNRGFMGGVPHQTQFQPQQSQMRQEPKQDFDEAAFQAAFDAAMEDAFQVQEQELGSDKVEEATGRNKFETYPHLPLIRLALLKAILDGSDYYLHEAALFVRQLGRHDIQQVDPIQAMLLRPLIIRLADQARSPFAKRYEMADYLQNLNEKYQEAEKHAQISPENEQLLAAYADCLWGRDQTDHLRDMTQNDTDESYWRVSLEEHTENWNTLDPTDQAMRMLSETNLFGLSTPDSMQRVQDLEVTSYQTRLSDQGLDAQLPGAEDPQGLLFNMARILRDEPDVQEAISRVRNVQNSDFALRDYQSLLAALPVDPIEEGALQLPFKQTDEALPGAPQQQLQEETLQQETQQQDQPTKDDDELAQTAADLLDKVSHEKSTKFQNSAFLGLMRKLADREVKVRDDKVVESNYQSPASEQMNAAPTSWSQSGPMQTPSTSLPQTHKSLPTDGQEVVDILNTPNNIHDQDSHEYEEGYLLPIHPDPLINTYGDLEADISYKSIFTEEV